MVMLVAGTGAAGIWANLWKENLSVLDVQVQGNSIVSVGEVLSLAGIAKGEKLFDVDLFAAQKRVMKNRFVRYVSVNREVPDRITITVEERVPIAAVIAERMLYLDAEGYVLPPVISAQIFDLPVISGSLSSSGCVVGKHIANEAVQEGVQVLAIARSLDDELYRRISEVRVDAGTDMIVYTAEFGVPVIFGRGDVGMKLVKFNAFWREFVATHGAHELAYVDLRFADQVVVRWNHDREEIKTSGEISRDEIQRTRSALLLPAAVVR
jgi:cell division protein FtsQ